MSKFNQDYMHLLRTQVEQEMQYLRNHGHYGSHHGQSCMFCLKMPDNSRIPSRYSCRRLIDLERFEASIIEYKSRDNPTISERRNIGFPAEPDSHGQFDYQSEINDAPLLQLKF